MNILVTGGAGFIGSFFVHEAVKAGHKVVVLDLLTYASHKETIESLIERQQIKFHFGDINDFELVSTLLKENSIDILVNFAAESHVDNSISGPAKFVHTNVNGVFQLLEAARHHYNNLDEQNKSNFRFIQISTDEVYGSLGATGKFTEESPFKPNSPYSASKAAGDCLARSWFHTYGLPVITTHCTNNFGPHQHPEKLIPKMISNALEGKELPIYGDGKNIRDWIYVGDHVAGIFKAIEHGKPGEVYDFGGGNEYSNNEIVEILCQILDEKLQPHTSYSDLITYVKDRPGHDMRYTIDDSKARRELGYKPNMDFEQGVTQTIDWFLANRNFASAKIKEIL